MSSLRKNYSKVSGTEVSSFLRQATLDGSLSGNADSNVNGSITPVEFWIQPDTNEIFEIAQISLTLSDSGNPSLEDYGSIIGPLSNGVQMFVELNGVKFNFGTSFKNNKELITLGASEYFKETFSSSVETSTHIFNAKEFAKRLGVRLNGKTQDKFGIRVQDDLTGLTSHVFSVGGSVSLGDVS